MTYPNFHVFDRGHLGFFFFSKRQKKIFSITAPNFLDCSQQIWEQSHQFLASPNFFGTNHYFINDRKCTKNQYLHTAPKYFGSSHFLTWLLPTYLGAVSQIFEMSWKSWEISLTIGRSHLFWNDRKCTKNQYLHTAPKYFGSSHFLK